MCGNSVLVGSDQEIIFKEMKKLLENKAYHCDLSHCERFGDGKASENSVFTKTFFYGTILYE